MHPLGHRHTTPVGGEEGKVGGGERRGGGRVRGGRKGGRSQVLTVRLTMVPNFSKWLLSLVMVFCSRGIFLTISVSVGWCGGWGPG